MTVRVQFKVRLPLNGCIVTETVTLEDLSEDPDAREKEIEVALSEWTWEQLDTSYEVRN